jgi:hypothetical protein
MALPESAIASSAGAPFGSDLHGFIEQYERAYPDEVLHIEEPLNAEWEISALAMRAMGMKHEWRDGVLE